jgi:predicted transcriptional regulator
LSAPAEELFVALRALARKTSGGTRVMPVDVMRETLRRFDRHRRQLLTPNWSMTGRAFQLASRSGFLNAAAA